MKIFNKIIAICVVCLTSTAAVKAADSGYDTALIVDQVLSAIKTRTDLSYSGITVEAGSGSSNPFWNRENQLRKGVVRIYGYVGSEHDRTVIGTLAESTPGVEVVQNQLVVAPALLGSDNQLAQSVLKRIEQSPEVKDYKVNIASRGPDVIISGEVLSSASREVIEKIARQTKGVRNLDNEIVVADPIGDEQLKERVRVALSREATLNLNDIDIKADSGVISVYGNRSDHREIDRILSITMMVPGVREIKSEMTINGHPYNTNR